MAAAEASLENVDNVPPALSGERLYRDVVTSSQLGEHRTATEVDRKTGAWIHQRLAAAGLAAAFMDWTLPQFFLREARLLVGDREIDTFPLWQPMLSGPEAVAGTLVRFQPADATVALENRVALLSGDDATQDNLLAAARRGAVAAVAVIPHVSREVYAQNARPPYDRQPLPIPMLIAGTKDESFLNQAATAAQTAQLTIDGELRHQAAARNVVARLDRGQRTWMVVSTPASGWFRCGGERGPGVAVLLGLAAWAASRDTKYNWLFMANAGHELNYMGIRRFLASDQVPGPESVRCWLHLGASIATRKWEPAGGGFRPTNEIGGGLYLISSERFLPAIKQAFAPIPELVPATEPRRGELEVVLERGYEAFGIFGGHQWFHTRPDGPESTTPELLQRVAAALLRSLETIVA